MELLDLSGKAVADNRNGIVCFVNNGQPLELDTALVTAGITGERPIGVMLLPMLLHQLRQGPRSEALLDCAFSEVALTTVDLLHGAVTGCGP